MSDPKRRTVFGRGARSLMMPAAAPAWNYMAPMYRPQQVVLDGEWAFPAAQPLS